MHEKILAGKKDKIFVIIQNLNLFESQRETIYQKIVACFQDFVYEFELATFSKPLKIIFHSILKTEGDILIDLDKIDLAIKCLKTIKDCCDDWETMDMQKMKCYE